jgi:proteasome activator subunit 4
LKYKQEIVSLLNTLINKTKSERGYSGTGHIIARILQALTGVYPLNSRFVNTGEWESPEFEKDHIIHWGRLYEPTDVDVEWHVPSEEEIAFVFEVLEKVATPALDKLESLLGDTESWDNVSRNDFCRYLNACRSIWLGLPTLYQEHDKKVANPCLDEEIETSELLVTHLDVKAGFVLTDPSDPRHRSVIKHRTRFGNIVQRAAAALRANTNGEDHIDAVIGVTKAIDVYLLAYGMDRGKFDALQKSYTRTREFVHSNNPVYCFHSLYLVRTACGRDRRTTREQFS